MASRPLRPRLELLALLLLAAPVRADEVPPFGPPLGAKADVVRAFEMNVAGAAKKTVAGKKGDGKTGLVGQCNPSMFANFGVQVGSAMSADSAGIAIVTQGKIATGATGTFPLDKIYVDWSSIRGSSIGAARYGGPGTLVLTVHDAARGARRMKGTIRGRGLEGLDEARGKRIDVDASFDMEFSCGVK